jgi:hypothetical protein
MLKATVALAALSALALAATANAKRKAPLPPGFRASTADAVVVGKVTEVSDKAEKAEEYRGDNREVKVATVRVASALLGKRATTVKVGFVVPAAGGRRRDPMPSLTRGQEACLFLTKHPTKKGVYYLAGVDDVIDKTAADSWKSDLDEVRKAAKVLTDPKAALQAKDAGERLLAAALLVSRYKTSTTGTEKIEKTEDVPAAESKLILTVLADADWDDTGSRGYSPHTPLSIFYLLGATAKDGWQPPEDFKQIATEAKKWCQASAGKYKMTRYVREKLPTQPSEEPEQ